MHNLNIERNLNLYLSKPSSPKTSLLAVLRYQDENNKVKAIVSLGSITTKHWDIKRQKLKSAANIPTYTNLEEAIKIANEVFEKTFDEYVLEKGRIPDRKIFQETIKALIKGLPPPNKDGSISTKKTKSVIEYAELFKEGVKSGNRRKHSGKDRGKPYAPNSWKAYHNLVYNLEKFRDYEGRKDILWSDIDLDWYENFRDYIIKKRSLSINYFGGLIKNLKVIMSDGAELGFHNNDKHKGKRFVKETAETDNIYLNEEQLDVLFNLDLSDNPQLFNAKELFLSGAYSGLRFSDFSSIKQEDIQGEYLEVETQKTKEIVSIPIIGNLKILLNRRDKVHPISNQKLNAYLKEIGEIAASKEEGKKAGFDKMVHVIENINGVEVSKAVPFYKRISSHTARRSFASNMFSLGVPTIAIMAVTGHKTETAFLKYIKQNNKEKAEIMMHVLKRNSIKLVPGGLL